MDANRCIPAERANAVVLSVRAVIALDRSELKETVDAPLECPFVGAANVLADGICLKQQPFHLCRDVDGSGSRPLGRHGSRELSQYASHTAFKRK